MNVKHFQINVDENKRGRPNEIVIQIDKLDFNYRSAIGLASHNNNYIV